MNLQQPDYFKRTLVLAGILFVIKIIAGGLIELSNDEVYYYTYAVNLQWSYFDHPPMVGFLIRLFTLNLHVHHEILIRLPAIICSTVCLPLVFRIGAILKDEPTGWIAVLLFTGSFYASIIAGLMILPDSPQLLFWILSIWLMLKLAGGNEKGKEGWRLLLLGISIGLAVISKVHAVFLWSGFIGFCLFHHRRIFSNPFLYLSMALTVLIILPAALWILGNDFSTYNYHKERVGLFSKRVQPDSFLRELIGEAIYNNPIVYFLMATGVFATIRKKYFRQQRSLLLLLWISLPLIGIVLLFSIWNDTLPHWTGPGFVTLIPLAAWVLREKMAAAETKLRLPYYAVWLCMTGLLLCMITIRCWPGTLGKKTLPHFGAGDVTLDIGGWKDFNNQFGDFLREESTRYPSPARCIFADYWFPGAHLYYYVGRTQQIPVKVTGALPDIHHFAWLNAKTSAMPVNSDAYYITISNFFSPPSPALKSFFSTVAEPQTIIQYRMGRPARYFFIYRLSGYKGGLRPDGIIR